MTHLDEASAILITDASGYAADCSTGLKKQRGQPLKGLSKVKNNGVRFSSLTVSRFLSEGKEVLKFNQG
jgi:hypothetical protein